MKLFPTPCLLLALIALDAVFSGEAFFSADGQSVTFVSTTESDRLHRIDLDSHKIDTIRVSLPKDQSITSLTIGADGEALFLTESAAWVHDAKGTRKLSDIGVENAGGLAVAPPKGSPVADWMFLAGQDKDDASRRIFYCRKPGSNSWNSTFCRRTDRVDAAVFTADGRFFFASHGDLWEGEFEPDDGQGAPTTLNGVRIAPVAFLNTDASNGGSMYVHTIMPAGESIYICLRGHHLGQLLRISLNQKPALQDSAMDHHYTYMAKMLSSAEIIDGEGSPLFCTAATAAGGRERVFYLKDHKLYLWTRDTGRAEEIGHLND